MLHGLMVINAFLHSTKFNELYNIMLHSAKKRGMELSVMSNAELCAIVDSSLFNRNDYDFVLFWDKDVTLAMQLEQKGLPVFNSANSIRLCDDKSLTYLELKKHNICMPKTIIGPKTFPAIGYQNADFIDEVASQLGLPIVMKECFGSFGQQVYLFSDIQKLKDKVKQLGATPLIFQQLVNTSFGKDVRVNVVGEKVVASMLRIGKDGEFRSNLTLGGTMENHVITKKEEMLAIKAVEKLGLTFAGVDLLFGEDEPVLCEVNSNAHFKTTLECTGVNMADEILMYIENKIGEKSC